MKKTTYKSGKKNIKKDLEETDLELTNVYKYTGKARTKAKLKNNAKIAKLLSASTAFCDKTGIVLKAFGSSIFLFSKHIIKN